MATSNTLGKHFDICLYFIRDIVKNDKIIVKYISTDETVANLLTKALPALKTKAQNI
jgi:hypothetical protein